MRWRQWRWASTVIVLIVVLAHLALVNWLAEVSQMTAVDSGEKSMSVSLLQNTSPKPVPLTQPRTAAPKQPQATANANDINNLVPTSSENPNAITEPNTASAPEPETSSTPAGQEWLSQGSFQYPPSLTLRYDAKGLSAGLTYFANSYLYWRHLDSDYRAELKVSAFLIGSRSFISEGRLGEHGLMPLRYFNPAREDQHANFDYDNARISFTDGSASALLLNGTQDRLSVFMQLSSLVASQPIRYVEGSILTFSTASTSATESWTFQVEKQETLSLAYGEIPTLKLSRIMRTPQDQRIEVWLAPQLHDLPVRMLITKPNGDYVDQQLHAVENPSP
jgi:Protein of unknown function (DUF3108)